MKQKYVLALLLLCISTSALANTLPYISFSAEPNLIQNNGNTTLVWSTNNAKSCVASGSWSGKKSIAGSEIVKGIKSTKNYSLSCTGTGGTMTAKQKVSISPKPSISFTAKANNIVMNTNATLNWSTTDANYCYAYDGWNGNQTLSGTFNTPGLAKSTTFTLRCSGIGGTTEKSITITPSIAAGVRLGINLSPVIDWMDNQYTFVDVMKQARTFVNFNDRSADIPLDVNGWPMSDFAVYFITSVADPLGQTFTSSHPSVMGTYKLSFNGTATLLPFDPGIEVVNVIYDANHNITTADIIVSSKLNQLALKFTNTQNGVQNIKLFRPGYPLTSKQLYTNEFLNALSPFSTLRLMDFLSTNANTIQTWADRSLVNQPSQAGAKGVAWEYIIELANASGKDIWLNIPANVDLQANASQNYVVQLAQLLKTNLNPNLHVYVEYSNEVWNTQFSQSQDNYAAAVAEVKSGADPSLNFDKINNQWYWAYRRIIHQTVKISRLFASVYGNNAINTIIRPVYMNQFVQPFLAEDGLYYLQHNFGDPKQFIYAIGGENYFNALGTETNLQSIQKDMVSALNLKLKNFVPTPTYNGYYPLWSNITYQSLANYYGLKNMTYEGGAANADNSALSVSAGNDVSVNTALQQELADAFGCGNALFMVYRLAGPTNDQWAIYSDYAIPTAKSQALLTVAQTPLINYKVCKSAVDSQLLVQ